MNICFDNVVKLFVIIIVFFFKFFSTEIIEKQKRYVFQRLKNNFFQNKIYTFYEQIKKKFNKTVSIIQVSKSRLSNQFKKNSNFRILIFSNKNFQKTNFKIHNKLITKNQTNMTLTKMILKNQTKMRLTSMIFQMSKKLY